MPLHLLTHFIFLAALPLCAGGLRSLGVLPSPLLWYRVGGALLSVLKWCKAMAPEDSLTSKPCGALEAYPRSLLVGRE